MEENKIGKFIAELQKEKKMTQKDLAARLFITDKAISKWERGLSCPDISWSLYPISSIIFAWFILIPIIKYGSKGMVASLIAISILIIPFLSVISKIIGSNPLIIPIGFRISLFAILYVWCVYFTFKGLKARKLAAVAFSLLLAIPLNIVIDIILSKYVSEELFSIWDICSFVIVIISAVLLFVIDYVRKREKK